MYNIITIKNLKELPNGVYRAFLGGVDECIKEYSSKYGDFKVVFSYTTTAVPMTFNYFLQDIYVQSTN